MRASLTALFAIAVLAAGCSTDAQEAVADDPAAESTPAETPGPDTATGDEDTGETQDTGDEEPVAGDAPSGARATDEAGDAEIDIRMFDFEDGDVEISVGETVTWTNQDATRHTVTSGLDGESDGAFEVTFDGRGDTASVTFDEPGEYTYFCTPHNFMTGTVTVTG